MPSGRFTTPTTLRHAASLRQLALAHQAVRLSLAEERREQEARTLEELAAKLDCAMCAEDVHAALETPLPYSLSMDASSVWSGLRHPGHDDVAAGRALARILLKWAKRWRLPNHINHTRFSQGVIRSHGRSRPRLVFARPPRRSASRASRSRRLRHVRGRGRRTKPRRSADDEGAHPTPEPPIQHRAGR